MGKLEQEHARQRAIAGMSAGPLSGGSWQEYERRATGGADRIQDARTAPTIESQEGLLGEEARYVELLLGMLNTTNYDLDAMARRLAAATERLLGQDGNGDAHDLPTCPDGELKQIEWMIDRMNRTIRRINAAVTKLETI